MNTKAGLWLSIFLSLYTKRGLKFIFFSDYVLSQAPLVNSLSAK